MEVTCNMSAVLHATHILNALSLWASFQPLKWLLIYITMLLQVLPLRMLLCMGLGFVGTIYLILAINIPTEDLKVISCLHSPFSHQEREHCFLALKCCAFEICQIHQPPSQSQAYPHPLEQGQTSGSSWGGGEETVKGVPLCQPLISQVLTGYHMFEDRCPHSWSSSAKNSNFERRDTRGVGGCVCVWGVCVCVCVCVCLIKRARTHPSANRGVGNSNSTAGLKAQFTAF